MGGSGAPPGGSTEAPGLTTACPRNCYSTCGMRVTVEAGRLRAIEADPANRATSKGVCLKGLAYVERVTASDRLLHPLRRMSDGGFGRVGWDEALAEIADRLVTTRDRFGPRSVLFYAGSGTKGLLNETAMEFWRLYGGCTTTYGDLCWPAGLEATRLTLGDNIHSAPWDIANARLILLWGKNPAETNIHQMRFIHEARERGAQVVVVDPRRTESAEAADLLIQPRPGSDGALALGIAHILVKEDAHDRSFVSRHVHGFDAFATMVQEYPPARVEEITRVPETAIRELADAMATTRPCTLCAGFGMQRYTSSGQTMRALISLLALTGNIGKKGAGWMYANLQSHVLSSSRDPLAFYPPKHDRDPVRVSVSTALLGEHILGQQNPALTFAWIERGNPVTQNPHTGRVLEALRSLDFRVVVDQFLTDTAREADLVLPAKTMFEQTDVLTAYWHPYLQIRQKLLEPPGEVLPETEVYFRLARIMGIPEESLRGRIPAPGDASVERHLEERLAKVGLQISLDDLRRGPVLPPGHQEIAFSDLVFPTPTGRIELLSAEAAERWGVDPVPRFVPPVEWGGGGDGSADRPLHLLTPNSKDRIHSQFNNLPSIRALHPVSRVHLSPQDAADRDVVEGEMVWVENDRGRLELEAAVDWGLRPGCVWITNGWWHSEGGGVNQLSAARETDLGHGAAFHDVTVEIGRR